MSMAMQALKSPVLASVPARPWWREPMVWLVIGGPLLVVVASFVTLGLALTHPDPVLQEVSHQAADVPADLRSMAAPDAPPKASTKVDPARLPAMQARNHAATGGL